MTVVDVHTHMLTLPWIDLLSQGHHGHVLCQFGLRPGTGGEVQVALPRLGVLGPTHPLAPDFAPARDSALGWALLTTGIAEQFSPVRTRRLDLSGRAEHLQLPFGC